MTFLFLASGASAFAAPAKATANSQPASPGRDPFCTTHVETTDAFVAMLRSNAALRQRYSRHFGVSEEKVVDFVRHALVPYTLPASTTLTTFGVTRSGMIYPVKDRLRKGTKVWATREGVPVFKWVCSNPLSYRLPDHDLTSPSLADEQPDDMHLKDKGPQLTQPSTLLANDGLSSQINLDFLAVAPPEPNLETSVGASSSSPLLDTIAVVGKNQVADFWPALLVPLVIPEPPKPNTPPGTSVPESGTAGLLAVGGSLFSALLFWKRKAIALRAVRQKRMEENR